MSKKQIPHKTLARIARLLSDLRKVSDLLVTVAYKKGAKDTFKRPKPAKRGSNVAGVVQTFGERTGKVKFPEKSYGKGVDKSA